MGLILRLGGVYETRGDSVRTQGEIEASRKGKEELAQSGIYEPGPGATQDERKIYQERLTNSAAYKKEMEPYGTGGSYQLVAQAATAALQGLAGNNLGSALAGASAPYLAQKIKQITGDNKEARLMAHAVLGAIVAQSNNNSAAAGAAGAVSGELAAEYIAAQLYPNKKVADLTEQEKQSVSAMATLAAGLLGGAVGGDSASAIAGAQSGKNAVENNYLSPAQEEQKDKELKGCNDLTCRVANETKWNLISAQQNAGLLVGVGGGIGLSAYETAEGLYQLMGHLPETLDAIKQFANSPEFRQQFGDSYFSDLEQRAALLTQAYNDAGWGGSVTAGVEGGKFAVELVGVLTAVRGTAQVAAKLPSAAKNVVNALAEAPVTGSWRAQAGAVGDLSKLDAPGGAKGNLTPKDFPDVAGKISQKQLRHIAGRPELEARGGGGFLNSVDDAQKVLDAYRVGQVKILGKNAQGFPVVKFEGVTGTNVNAGVGITGQPTNVFIIKGTKSPSIVPANPNWTQK